MIAPCPTGSPLLDFCLPKFSEFSDQQNRRALVDHFCNVLSHLIVFREETGNPFQQLVLPLTRGSSPVTYAIFALASAHLEYRGVENAEKSLYFHNMAIRGVSQLIEHNSQTSRNEILAAIMLLVYYECLVQKGHSNIVAGHLKGALTIMASDPDSSDPTSIFLERAFRFYDVITALSNGTTPLSAAPTPGCLLPLSPLGVPSASPLGNVDTLLGMSTTLWPIIHRLAGLRALKNDFETAIRTNETPSKIAVLRTEVESTAQAIESALLQWQPQLPPGFSPDDTDCSNPTDAETHPLTNTTHSAEGSPGPSPSIPSPDQARLASILHNALAYRHASLVYLYRTVLGQPRASPAVQNHAHLAIVHCVATVGHKGPMSALLWPLFVSACEAVTSEDRKLTERAFVEVDKRQGMRNIDRAWGIVKEVWRRADKAELDGADGDLERGVVGIGTRGDGGGEEMWRRVCREMGVSIVFG
ncbi:fungal-specific transcription factor domain-containing protein [Chaetomium strumarium]|uniref:Fungal-specific transcription factor domain-containing protein n=1 Tax=Chaetomium strumarium TaxID=1170767 RepID=A0AAJ0M0N0_9PEZI|nr:fungal-specific transcription factor domain-containing protein [Chaetomium strumarium]